MEILKIIKSVYLEGILFLFCLLLGILISYKDLKVEEELVHPFFSLLFFLLIFLFFIRKDLFYKLLFLLAVIAGGTYALNVLTPLSGFWIMIVLSLLWFKIPKVFTHNLIIILGIAGAGSILGKMLFPETVIILLIVFSLYDVIAVYKTKHMVKMAEGMIEAKAVLGLIIPIKIKDLLANFKKINLGEDFYVLGAGDVAFPLVLAVSILPQGILNSLIISFFSLIGLFFTFWIFITQKVRSPIPALPPIALFSIIGYLITFFI